MLCPFAGVSNFLCASKRGECFLTMEYLKKIVVMQLCYAKMYKHDNTKTKLCKYMCMGDHKPYVLYFRRELLDCSVLRSTKIT